MRKFKIREELIRKAYAKKYLEKMVEEIQRISFSKDTLLDYLDKHFYGISFYVDIPKKNAYLHCFKFNSKLGGISLDMKYCELACDLLSVKLNESTVNRINRIINSTVIL